jgi:hypothetical protein
MVFRMGFECFFYLKCWRETRYLEHIAWYEMSKWRILFPPTLQIKYYCLFEDSGFLLHLKLHTWHRQGEQNKVWYSRRTHQLSCLARTGRLPSRFWGSNSDFDFICDWYLFPIDSENEACRFFMTIRCCCPCTYDTYFIFNSWNAPLCPRSAVRSLHLSRDRNLVT